jgi:hypothetical protein
MGSWLHKSQIIPQILLDAGREGRSKNMHSRVYTLLPTMYVIVGNKRV